MIPISPQHYHEQYRIPFQDVTGTLWKICIQSPDYEGEVTILTGDEIPVEWMGIGDESQEDVVLGSTGTLRLICLEGQQGLFTRGNIFPTAINDRRVQIFRQNYPRYGEAGYVMYWQGFIKPEVFTQDWDATPYVIELPIVSVVAAMEYFRVPAPGDIYSDYFSEITDIAGLIRRMTVYMGVYIERILTNNRLYYDINGNTHEYTSSEPVHWTQGKAYYEYFYEITDGNIKTKTFKEVLETICYPYGKVQDYATDLAFLIRWKDDAVYRQTLGSQLYRMDVWADYEGDELQNGNRFELQTGQQTQIKELSTILPEGTDNKISKIMPPHSVEYSNRIEREREIFSLQERFIKPSLPIGYNKSESDENIYDDTNIQSTVRRMYSFKRQYVNLGFADNWVFENTDSSLADFAFCRVIEAKKNNGLANFSKFMPLGFCFNFNNADGRQDSIVKFQLKKGVRTQAGLSILKISFSPYAYGIEEKTANFRVSGPSATQITLSKLFFNIKDITAGRYLHYSSSSNIWYWNTQEADPINVENLTHSGEGSDYILYVNEYRGSNDTSPHILEFTIGARMKDGDDHHSKKTYGTQYTGFTIEYADYNIINDHGEVPESALMSEMASGISLASKVFTPSVYPGVDGEEELSIDFKTQCGTKNAIVDASIFVPYNSFCDAVSLLAHAGSANERREYLIDLREREKIEISDATFEFASSIDFDLVRRYAVFTDGNIKQGGKVYIPVAVGMNPAKNTIKLTLVSSNISMLL